MAALAALAAVVVGTVTSNATVATVCYLGVVVGASVGAWAGVAATAPGERRVPRLIAVGLSLSATGDVLWAVLDLVGAGTDASIADLPWFATYVVLCAAMLVLLGRSRTSGLRRVDLDFAMDLVTIVVVSVLVFWSFSITSIVADHGTSPLVRTVLAAYPVADAVLLALVVRVLVSRRALSLVGPSFAVGVSLWLAADIAYLNAPDSSVVEGLMDAAWMVAPVLLARAAWPTRTDQSSAQAAPSTGAVGWVSQMTIAVGPLMVPPALELVADLRGLSDRPVQLFTGTAALITLAFIRTARLIGSEERARRGLEAARDAALAASEAKSMFVANVSHEIRTPLTTMLATGEMLEDTPLDPVQVELLAKLNRSGGLLKGLVEGLLDFSRIEAGQLDLMSTPFDLHAMVADLADVYDPRASQGGLRFSCRVDPGVPRIIVGDSGRIFQILTNILDNAVKFTDRGTVTLTVAPTHLGDESDPRDAVEFVVTDTGIGIRDEDRLAIFESFWQVDGSMTRTYGGSGLGLAICDQLVRLMAGSLTVRSRPGEGSTFVVRIPLSHG